MQRKLVAVAVITIAVVVAIVAVVPPVKVPTVAVAVPSVVVHIAAAIAFPVTHKVLRAIITRNHPTSSGVRRLSPITGMPAVAPSRWIPITFYPHELRAGPAWQDADYAGRRWRANVDPDPDGDLAAEC